MYNDTHGMELRDASAAGCYGDLLRVSSSSDILLILTSEVCIYLLKLDFFSIPSSCVVLYLCSVFGRKS